MVGTSLHMSQNYSQLSGDMTRKRRCLTAAAYCAAGVVVQKVLLVGKEANKIDLAEKRPLCTICMEPLDISVSFDPEYLWL